MWLPAHIESFHSAALETELPSCHTHAIVHKKVRKSSQIPVKSVPLSILRWLPNGNPSGRPEAMSSGLDCDDGNPKSPVYQGLMLSRPGTSFQSQMKCWLLGKWVFFPGDFSPYSQKPPFAARRASQNLVFELLLLQPVIIAPAPWSLTQ